MAKNGNTVEENREATKTPETEASASTGRRARSSFMMKNFADQDFINKHVVAKGKGTKAMLGRVFGFVSSVSEKKGTLPNGEPSVSIVLHGQFETESYIDGEISSCSSVFFPNGFARDVQHTLASDDTIKVLEIDTDVGVEATGKSIPYAWVIVNHIEGQAVSPLKKLKAARGRPEGVLQLPPKEAPKQLTAG